MKLVHALIEIELVSLGAFLKLIDIELISFVSASIIDWTAMIVLEHPTGVHVVNVWLIISYHARDSARQAGWQEFLLRSSMVY